MTEKKIDFVMACIIVACLALALYGAWAAGEQVERLQIVVADPEYISSIIVDEYDGDGWTEWDLTSQWNYSPAMLDDVLFIDWPSSILITDVHSQTTVIEGPVTVRFGLATPMPTAMPNGIPITSGPVEYAAVGEDGKCYVEVPACTYCDDFCVTVACPVEWGREAPCEEMWGETE